MLPPAVRILQTVAGCRWSRPAVAAPGTHLEPTEAPFVCVRPTATAVRRPVTEDECATCLRWEMNATIDD
jgi:hypothetical protein